MNEEPKTDDKLLKALQLLVALKVAANENGKAASAYTEAIKLAENAVDGLVMAYCRGNE